MTWICFHGLRYFLLTSEQFSSRFGCGLEDSTQACSYVENSMGLQSCANAAIVAQALPASRVHSCANVSVIEISKDTCFPPMSRRNPIVAQTPLTSNNLSHSRSDARSLRYRLASIAQQRCSRLAIIAQVFVPLKHRKMPAFHQCRAKTP